MRERGDRALADRVAAVVGRDAVRDGGAAERWAVCGRPPAAVAAPPSTGAVAELLELASREGWTVEPAGSGSRLSAGRATDAPDLVVTTERLNDLHEYEPADLTAALGAGTSLDALRERLRPHDQWLALDPPSGPSATVGAMLATAAAGPLRRGYGTPRDHVLGLELVTGDGRVLSPGGRVVKNVAGYDLAKPVTGSRGTLGIVTRVNLRLRPLPERDATVALRAPEVGPLIEAVDAVHGAHPEPVALELLSPAAAEHVVDGGGWTLLARLQGNAEAVRRRERRLRQLRGGDGSTLDAAAARAAWTELRGLEATATVGIRFADRRSRLESTLMLALDTLRDGLADESAADAVAGRRPVGGESGAADGSGPVLAAHAGDGIVRLLLDAGTYRAASADRLAAALAGARERAAPRGATVHTARAPRALAERFDPFGEPDPVTLRLMRGLKAAFDPAGVLAPGRFLDGL